ncbi:multiheme c-type cytochrome [soil metagenome]
MDAPDTISPDRPKLPFPWEAVVVGLLGTLIALGLVGWVLLSEPATSPEPPATRRLGYPHQGASREHFVGNDACSECHPSETAFHARHGHSRTLRPAEDRLLAQQLVNRRVKDPEQPGVFWTYHLEKDGLHVERDDGFQVDRVPLEYAFGSGYHATTFVSMLDPDADLPHALEHRLTYFADTDTIGITPGQKQESYLEHRDILGRFLERIEAWQCFSCHVTMPSGDDLDSLDVTTMIPNITCERCHGPGKEHVEQARRGAHPDELAMPFGPGRWTVESQLQLCGACHRHPDQTPAGYKIEPENNLLARFQPVGMMQSACFTKSDGALSCVTCHDPHARPSKDHAFYESICLSCHQAEPSSPQVACPVSPRNGCVDCHMPPVNAGQGVLYSDHWIRVRDDISRSSHQMEKLSGDSTQVLE